MDFARSHQRRFRRKLKLLIPRRRRTQNDSSSPENGESKPLASNDSSDAQGGEYTKQTTTIETEVESSEGSREVPRSRAASPRPTNTEQMLARVNLEKALWMQARQLVGVVNVDLGFSMGRFDVCTSMVAPRLDHSGPSGSTPATYVTRTIASIHATHETAGEWRIVVQGNGVFYSAVDSLEAYVIELQMQLEERAVIYRSLINGV